MSTRRAAIIVCLGLAATLAGCDGDGAKTDEEQFVIRPSGQAPSEAARNLYKLQLYYITQRLGLGEETPWDFWRLLDDRVLPPEQRAHLAANGFRLAVGGELAMKRIDAAIAARPSIQVQLAPGIFARQGYALDVPYGEGQQDFALLLHRADGTVVGRDFQKGSTLVRFQCLAGDEPNTTDVILTEWIIYGEPQPVYRPTPTGMALVKERPKFWLEDLAVRLRIREGQILVIGPELGRSLSVGEHLFVRREEPYTFVTAIILAPQLVTPGSVPPGTPVAGQEVAAPQ